MIVSLRIMTKAEPTSSAITTRALGIVDSSTAGPVITHSSGSRGVPRQHHRFDPPVVNPFHLAEDDSSQRGLSARRVVSRPVPPLPA